YDGISVGRTWTGDERSLELAAFAGINRLTYQNDGPPRRFDSRPVLGGGATWRGDEVELRAHAALIRVGALDPDSQAELDALRALAGASPGIDRAIADNDTAGVHLRYAGMGARWTPGAWLVAGELAVVRSSGGTLPSGERAYLTLAHRWGDWQPHATWSRSWDRRRYDYGPPPPGLDALVAGLQREAYRSVLDQETISLGVRWDLAPRVAWKLQWDLSRISTNSGYLSGNGAVEGGWRSWFTTTIDWAF
ncbi:MAG: hypothetical protein RLZZ598_1492, partial [Pseudomonadota bacterium]